MLDLMNECTWSKLQRGYFVMQETSPSSRPHQDQRQRAPVRSAKAGAIKMRMWMQRICQGSSAFLIHHDVMHDRSDALMRDDGMTATETLTSDPKCGWLPLSSDFAKRPCLTMNVGVAF